MKRDINFWLIQVPGWLLLCYLVYAQAIPAFNYETGVDMGTHFGTVSHLPTWLHIYLFWASAWSVTRQVKTGKEWFWVPHLG